MADLSSLKNKLGDVQKIMSSVKSMLSPTQIPESAKDNPIGYRLTEIVKTLNTVVENHNKQSDELAKLDEMLGELIKELQVVLDMKNPVETTAEKKPEQQPEMAEEESKEGK